MILVTRAGVDGSFESQAGRGGGGSGDNTLGTRLALNIMRQSLLFPITNSVLVCIGYKLKTL